MARDVHIESGNNGADALRPHLPFFIGLLCWLLLMGDLLFIFDGSQA